MNESAAKPTQNPNVQEGGARITSNDSGPRVVVGYALPCPDLNRRLAGIYGAAVLREEDIGVSVPESAATDTYTGLDDVFVPHNSGV